MEKCILSKEMDYSFNTVRNAAQEPKVVYSIITIAIVVVIIVLYYYLKPKRKEVAMMGPYPLTIRPGVSEQGNMQYIMNAEDMSRVQGNNLTVGFFVYMDGVNRENIPLGSPDGEYRFKYLFILGGSMGVKFDPIHQKAIFDIYSSPMGDSIFHEQQIVVEKVYVSRWNQLVVTIEGRTVDIYMNGKLVNSTLLKNVPLTSFSGIWLNSSPDFSGQTGLIQVWPERRTLSQIAENYERNTDVRGKPQIPDSRLSMKERLKELVKSMCTNVGLCGFRFQSGPLEYIDYEFA
jgi:hypothetical protein